MLKNYGIGGNEIPVDAYEAVADIPQNRTLMVEKLTDTAPLKPEIIQGLQTVEAVFEHFKPQVKVEYETVDGMTKPEDLRFKNLGSFGVKGITAQSYFLQDVTTRKEEYQKIVKLLKSNKILRDAVANPEKREAILDVIHTMIQELKQSDIK